MEALFFDYLALWMFPALMLALVMGFHVAFSMMGVALLFGYLTFGDAVIFQLIEKVDSVSTSFILAAVPLFIFMGAMLERTGIAEKLFEALTLWTARLPGGLALSAIGLSVVFAATAGVVGATEAVVGLLALPVMLKYGYDKGLISGTICAGGSLGTVIPPSLTVIILGPVADVSVGKLFAGMVFPGLIMAGCYITYIVVVALLCPEKAPRASAGLPEISFGRKLAITFSALLPPLFLIFAVLGTIVLGMATPTEAAAMGVLAATALATFHRALGFEVLKESLLRTVRVTCMILLIIVGGNMFASVFTSSGGMMLIDGFFADAALNRFGVLALILAITFITGFLLDWISIVLIIIPIAMPLITGFGFDPVWFCVLFLIVIQTSYLTPPLAPAIFYLKGIAPKEITLSHMFKGVVPFILLHFVVLALILFFPDLVTSLPEKMSS